MYDELRGKIAVVTGGAGGIGRFVCEALSKEGVHVVIVDNGDSTDALALIDAAGGKGQALFCDLESPQSIGEIAEKIKVELGGCDILLHVAALQSHNLFEDVTFEHWKKTLAVNLDSLFLLCQAFLPGMKKAGWGRIISITSATIYGAPPRLSEYVTSKSGIMGLSRILAREAGPFDITVNCIAPGLIATQKSREMVTTMTAAGERDYLALIVEEQCISRSLIPADIVGPILFLASNQSAGITGQTLLVDAGWRNL
jgi:3-oxoacyl-[acyl-carrier protein] reductase/(S)-1-phenylethanol dehydrogenase